MNGLANHVATGKPYRTGGYAKRLFAVALIAAVPLWFVDPLSAWLTITVALTTVPLRQLLMPAINSASDNKNRRRFNLLHGLSVLAALAQMAVLGYVLARIAT